MKGCWLAILSWLRKLTGFSKSICGEVAVQICITADQDFRLSPKTLWELFPSLAMEDYGILAPPASPSERTSCSTSQRFIWSPKDISPALRIEANIILRLQGRFNELIPTLPIAVALMDMLHRYVEDSSPHGTKNEHQLKRKVIRRKSKSCVPITTSIYLVNCVDR